MQRSQGPYSELGCVHMKWRWKGGGGWGGWVKAAYRHAVGVDVGRGQGSVGGRWSCLLCGWCRGGRRRGSRGRGGRGLRPQHLGPADGSRRCLRGRGGGDSCGGGWHHLGMLGRRLGGGWGSSVGLGRFGLGVLFCLKQGEARSVMKLCKGGGGRVEDMGREDIHPETREGDERQRMHSGVAGWMQSMHSAEILKRMPAFRS